MHRRIVDFPTPDDLLLSGRVERARIFRRLHWESSANFYPTIQSSFFLNATPRIAPLFLAPCCSPTSLIRRFSSIQRPVCSLLATGNTDDTRMFHFLIFGISFSASSLPISFFVSSNCLGSFGIVLKCTMIS